MDRQREGRETGSAHCSCGTVTESVNEEKTMSKTTCDDVYRA